ncbi:hypothetical protein BH23PLA1_BH23PLA1_34990 [soil metagenome]
MSEIDRGTILENLSEAVIAADRTGRVVFANSAADQLLSSPAGGLLGLETDVIFPAMGNPFASSGLPDGQTGNALASKSDGSTIEVQWTRSRCPGTEGSELVVLVLRESRQSARRDGRESLLRYLRITSKLTARLGSQPHLEVVLQIALETLLEDFEAEIVRVWLLDESSGRLELRASGEPGTIVTSWPSGTSEEQADLPPEVLEVNRLGRPFVVSRMDQDPRFDRAWVARNRLVSLVALPLLVADQRCGVLVAGFRVVLTTEGLDALLGMASILSASLNDVRLLERERAARIEADAEHRRFQTIVELIPIGVALAEGPEGRVTLINPAGRAIWEKSLPHGPLSLEEYNGLLPVRRADGSICPTDRRPLWRAFHKGECVREILRYRRPDGRDRVLEVTATPLPGRDVGAITTIHDITERLELQSELAERASQFNALLDHLPVGVAYFDDDCRCRACNGPAWKILGRSRSQIIGTPAQDLFADAPGLLEAVRRCVAEHAPHAQANAPWTDEPGNGDAVRFLDWRFEPLPLDSSGKSPGALALIVDVTGRKRAADALQAAKEAAEQSVHNKSRFLSAISHDLRTPVNALNLLAEMLGHVVSSQAEPDRDLIRLVSDLRRASANLVELINDLLDLNKFDSGEVEQHLSDFEVQEWLDANLGPLSLSARSKGLKFRWQVDRTGIRLRADRVKLGRVLTDLVGNAIKFTEVGGVAVEASLDPVGWLSLEVRDTGVGIPADQMERIFDEFAQLRNPERDRTKGTGLGLAICRRLVESVGGRLSVASRPGSGSTFTVVYPVQPLPDIPPQAEPPSRFEVQVPPVESEIRRPSILLVEDDLITRVPMVHLLEQAGYDVSPACDGLEALEALERQRPDLVLLDLMMPGLDGTEVLQRIRADRSRDDLPVVILSGDVLDERVRQLMALGASGTLAKPVDFNELFKLVARHAGPGRPVDG